MTEQEQRHGIVEWLQSLESAQKRLVGIGQHISRQMDGEMVNSRHNIIAPVDEAYATITGNLSEQDRDDLAKRAAKMAVLVKSPERVRGVCEHIADRQRVCSSP